MWTWQSIPGYQIEPGAQTVEQAYLDRQSGIMVEVTGQVVRILSDNRDDLEHQNFVVRLPSGQTLVVAHEIASSKRIPVAISHQVTVRGEYSWTEPGGIIYRTHRDISTKRRHGWIEHQGKKYD